MAKEERKKERLKKSIERAEKEKENKIKKLKSQMKRKKNNNAQKSCYIKKETEGLPKNLSKVNSPKSELSIIPENIKKASRNLFGNQDINIISHYSIKPEEIVDSNLDRILVEIGLSQKLNFTSFSGLCYSCTYNLTHSNYGIRCASCIRSYHITCLKRHSLHKSNALIFHCKTCLDNTKL